MSNRRSLNFVSLSLAFFIFAFSALAVSAQVTVNPGAGSYPTLADAFTAINGGTHTGAITVDITADTVEPVGGAILNASGAGAASYTSILIQPSGGAVRTIGGTATAGLPLIDFNGADNVTIDGLNTGGNALVITNTTVSATSGTSTIRFIGGATNNTITNSTIQGSGTHSVATNGAVIFFSTDGITANGNDNNTISNNNIGPAGANLPTKGMLCNGSTGTTAIGNSGLLINNNNIFDYFGAAVTSSGIAVNGGCNTFSITNNRFYQTAARTWTTGSIHRAIDLSSATATSGVQGMTVTGNIIGYASNSQTGVYTLTGAGAGAKFQGIVHNGISTGTTSNVNNNTVAAVSMTGVTAAGTSTASPFIGVLLTEGNLISNGNTIGSQSATGSLTFSTTTTSATDVYGIYNFSSNAWTSNNNNVGGISVTNLGASGTFLLYSIRAFTAGTTLWTATSNNVGGTIANSTQLTATGTASQVVGMFTSNAPTSLTSNVIRNLTSNIGTGTTTSASVIGISVTSTTPNHTMSQNTIHTLTNTNATAASVVTGIQFTGSTASVVERNFIHNLVASTTSATAEINGIRIAGGTTQYRNNMIALGANQAVAIGGTATNSGTTGINGFNEALGTNQFFHNSVYIGGTAASGSGASYAFNGTQVTNTRSNRDNIFFNARTNSGGTGTNYAVKYNGTVVNPTGLTVNNNVYFVNGTGGVFGYYNGADRANLAAWQAAIGQDGASYFSNPQYNDPMNAVPDLHLHPTNPTVAEGNGVDVGVVLDFDGQTRSGLTPVDIGADAGNFSGIDLAAPGISYTAFLNTSSVANRILAVTITDVTGVATGATAPRIYFNKNAGAYSSTACTLGSGTVNNGVWNCTIDNALIGGVVATDVIRYHVVAQDTLGNLASNPSAGFTGTNVNTVITPPTTPNQYTIVAAITGTFSVDGIGGGAPNFASLTNAGGIFEYINNSEVTGNITIDITADLTGETGAVALNQYAPGFSITIKPSGAPRSITSTATATGLIVLNGADNVMIDGSLSGGTDRSLSLINSNSTGSGTTVVALFSAGIGAGATGNTIKNTIIQNGTKFEATTASFNFGIYAGSGASATSADLDNLTIQNNLIQRTQIGIQAVGFTGGVLNGLVIQDNEIGGAVLADYVGRLGMTLGLADGAVINRNLVRNIEYTAAANGIGILATTGFVNSSITKNQITNLHASNNGGYGMTGISIETGTAASGLTVANNFVSDLRGYSWTTGVLGDTVVGIRIRGTNTGGINLWYNSVNLFGNYAGSTNATVVASLMVHGTGHTNLDIRNNILVNLFDNTAGVGDSSYAIYTTSPNTMFNPIDYNDYFVAAAAPGVLGAINSVNAVDLATLAAATGGDANSISADPLFTSNTDLRTLFGSPTQDQGTAVAVLDDIDGNIRSVVGFAGGTPDMGAKERLGPTSAAGSIGGRVSTAFGSGVRGAAIVVTGNSLPTPIIVKTGSLGYFQVDGLQTGETYVITVVSKRFTFSQPSRVINLTDSINDADFIANPQD